METKLTLRLNGIVIRKAKQYARNHKVSLSKMIESYLESITRETGKEEPFITPLVESLSGVINLPDEFDYKKDYRDFLDKKHQ